MFTEISETPALVPITALEFVADRLISGEGSYCHIYNLEPEFQTELQIKVLSSNTIHGIRPKQFSIESRTDIIFFGGKHLKVISFDGSWKMFRLLVGSNEIQLFDWIWDCVWLEGKDESFIAAHLGHNSVSLIECISYSVVKHVQCQESCILYSAKLIGRRDWNDVIALAGTVFNQIVVWSVAGQLNDSGNVPVMHRLSGHKGVISGIDYNEERRQLCSVSDDRSIRIWQLVADVNKTSNSKDSFVHIWAGAEFQEIQVLFGHTARVWNAKLLTDSIVSVGEDSICALWNIEGQIIQKFKGHKGKSIWSLAVNNDERLIATGGGDASIRIWKRFPVVQQSETVEMSLLKLPPSKEDDFPRIVKLLDFNHVLVMSNEGQLTSYDLMSKEWKTLMDNPSYASYSIVSPHPDGKMIAVGNIHGSLMLLFPQEESNNSTHLEEKFYDGKVYGIQWLSSSCGSYDLMLTTGPDGHLIISQIACTEGRWEFIERNRLFLPTGKQRWVSACCAAWPMSVLVCGDRQGSIHVYANFNAQLSRVEVSSEMPEHYVEPIQSFNKVHGAAGVTFIGQQKCQIYTCGRDGQIRVYKILDDFTLHLLHTSKVCKGFDWLTRLLFTQQDLIVLGFHSNQFSAFSKNTNQCLLSIPCGGGHRAWDFCMSGENCRLVYIKKREIAVYKSTMLSYQTVVKPSLHGREITSIKHLADYSTSSGVAHLLLTSGEDGFLNLISVHGGKFGGKHSGAIEKNQVSKVLSSTRGHCSSIRTITISRTGAESEHLNSSKSESDAIVFTGGGRGQIFAWKICFTFGDQHPPTAEENAKGRNVRNSILSRTAGEDCGIDTWWECLGLHSFCNKGRKNLKPWKKSQYNPSPETRYVTLDSFNVTNLQDGLPSNLHVILAGCSVGFLRIFCFDASFRVFHLLANSSFHDHCLLQVQHFIHVTSSSNQKQAFVLSAGTDGRIALWDISSLIVKFCESLPNLVDTGPQKVDIKLDDYESDSDSLDNISFESVQTIESQPVVLDSHDLQPKHVYTAHQSGVNSMDVRKIDGDQYLIASGGDDNSIDVVLFDISTNSIVNQLSFASAHAAQITGVKILRDDILVSASIDQRVILWQVDVHRDLKMNVLSTTIVDVADIADLDCWMINGPSSNDDVNEFILFLCGIGIQCLHLKVQNDEEVISAS